ncbi:MAG TPA: hypothetical protein VF941_11335, partial [Clostridia bacterium]
MELEELEVSVIKRPGMYFGSLNVQGIKEMIFYPLWTLRYELDELRIELHISISSTGISVRLNDIDMVLNRVFKNIDCSLSGYLFFYASLVPVKYAIIYYGADKTFKFSRIVQLRDFQKQFYNITAIEYFVDYSFFKDFTEKHKLFFELKGKAQIFTAINNGCKITMKDEILSVVSEIYYPEGIDDYLREIDNDRTTACSGMIFRSSNKNELGTFKFSMRVH